MDKELDNSDLQSNQDSTEGRSLVGKLKKNVSEIISQSPLSKWFRKDSNSTASATRRRQEDSEDEEDLQEFQPPAKRTKLPPVVTKESLCLNVSESLSPIAGNNVKKSFRHFPEPIAGPSGYETRKMLNSTPFVSNRSHNDKGNASDNNIFKMPQEMPISKETTHSDSEESTSGYSSGRLGSKEILSQQNSKQTSPLETSPGKNRSLFQNSTFPSQSNPRQTSLSSRNPSFNPSTFASPSFADRTTSTKKILSSPFYNGKTIYGGAAAYGTHTGRSARDIQKVLRQGAKIKPVSTFTNVNNKLGRTAQRIMDTLEQYSSPINDAKKIPVASKKSRIEGSLSKFIGANPYIVSRNASNQALHVPSLTDSLKRQQKAKLQETTEVVRQIAGQSSSRISNSDSYQLPVQRDNEKFTSKMKTKVTSVRQKQQIVDKPEVNLPPISLPIKELPKFDFKPAVAQKTNEQNDEFQFSAPLVLAKCLKPLKALNNFKFSEPLVKKRKSIHEQDKIIVESPKVKKINGDINNESLIEKFKPKEGSWECSTCLIRNQPDKIKCAACQNPKIPPKAEAPISAPITLKIPPKADTSITPAPIALKLVGNSWECPTCMIKNKEELQKCAACQENKPKPPLTNSFSKKSAGSWECPSCMIINKNEQTNCLACTVPKPGSSKNFGADFKKKSDEWECESCMVRNKTGAEKCQCCGAANPDKPAIIDSNKSALDNKSAPAFSFGMDYNGKSSFSFGIPVASQNAPKTNASLVFGEKREVKTSETATFSFGIPAESSDKVSEPKITTSEVKPTFSFGSSEAATLKPTSEATLTSKSEATLTKAAPTFSFGSANNDTQKSEKTSFNFGTKIPESVNNKAENTQRINPLLKPGEKLPEKAAVAPAGFSFGDKVTKRTREEDPVASNGDLSKKNALFAPAGANFSFGSNSTALFNDGSKQEMFKFGSSNNSSKPSNGFSFGATQPIETKPFSFTANQSAEAFSFGKTPEPKPLVTFDSDNKQTANQFSFTPPVKQSAFGESAPAAFNFTANQKPVSFNAAGNLFGGAPPPVNVNGSFSFGATSVAEQKPPAAGGGFSFGQNNAGFNFAGSAAGAATSGGGFNFGAAAPALDASAKPSFNFSGGSAIAAFSAPPAQEGTSAPQRKIKKAVRRTVR